jgi:hypothetical protein
LKYRFSHTKSTKLSENVPCKLLFDFIKVWVTLLMDRMFELSLGGGAFARPQLSGAGRTAA